MAGSTAGGTGRVGRLSPAMPKRSTRTVKPSVKAMEMNRRDNRMPTDTGKRTTKRIRRASTTDTDYEPSIHVSSETTGGDSERVLLEKVLDELKDLKKESIKQRELICKLEQEVINTKEQFQQVVKQLEATTRTATTSSSPGNGRASNIRSLSSGATTPENGSESLFCAIDVSNVRVEERRRVTPGEIRAAVESVVREEKESPAWRCRAVTKDLKAPHRIRVVCRDEEEHRMIKRIVGKRLPQSVRILRDEYYPIKGGASECRPYFRYA
ncbi:reverse transcriptase [Trichoderma arundinaceum]|uniref:Reverse transcriptase n=1 Tax=Trichoderma arundinaceum TaxID=490622 RepID=A0A395NCI5_TRIAR|nr:reverse transcriptase [Trichoderma arundinaceum]